MAERTVHQFLESRIGREANLLVTIDLETLSRVDVHAFTLTDGDDFERCKALDFQKSLRRQALFSHIEEGTYEGIGFTFGDACTRRQCVSQLLQKYLVVHAQ